MEIEAGEGHCILHGTPRNFGRIDVFEEGQDLHRFCSGQVFILGGPLFEGHGGFPAEG